MAILTREQILEQIKGWLGDDTSDEALKFVEDITESLDNYETLSATGSEWKTKFEQNDAEWRQKYRDRFFNSSVKDDLAQLEKQKTAGDPDNERLTFDKLFKTEE